MKKSISIVFVCLFSFAFGQNAEQITADSLAVLYLKQPPSKFPNIDFAKVIGYTFNSGNYNDEAKAEISICEGFGEYATLANNIDKITFVLSSSQSEELLNIVNDSATYFPYTQFNNERALSNRILPHHGFVFYNSQNKVVAWLNVSFRDRQLEGTSDTSGRINNLMENFINKSGWIRLNKLCKRIGMPIDQKQDAFYY